MSKVLNSTIFNKKPTPLSLPVSDMGGTAFSGMIGVSTGAGAAVSTGAGTPPAEADLHDAKLITASNKKQPRKTLLKFFINVLSRVECSAAS